MNLSSTRRTTAAWCCVLSCFLSVLALSCGKKSPTDSTTGKWEPVNTGLESMVIKILAIHPTNSDIIFAGTWGGLYKSTDGAQTWTRMDSGWTYTQVSAIAFDAVKPQTMYAGTEGSGVFKSEDGGESWEPKNTGLEDLTIYGIATDPQHADTLFIGSDGDIYRSCYAADSLSKIHWLDGAFLAIDPQNSQRVYAGGRWNEFFKSEDGGEVATWLRSSDGLPLGGSDRRIKWVLIDPITPGVLYAAANPGGFFKSTNFANRWDALTTGLGIRDAQAIGLDFSDPDILYGATDQGVYRSTDAGQTWKLWNEGLTEVDVTALAVAPVPPHMVYAGTWGGGIFKRKPQ